MNFINQVVEMDKEVNLHTIETNIPKLVLDVTSLKSEMNRFTDTAFDQYMQKMHKNDQLLQEVKSASQTLAKSDKILKECSETNVTNVTVDVKHHEICLSLLQNKIVILSMMMELYADVDEINKFQENKLYSKAVSKYNDIMGVIRDIPNNEKLSAVDHLKGQLLESMNSMQMELITILQKNINFEKFNEDKEYMVVLSIKNAHWEMEEVCKSLYMLQADILHLQQLAKFCIDNIVQAIILHNVEVVVIRNNDCCNLCIKRIDEIKTNYKTIFLNIIKFVSYLAAALNYKLNDDSTVINYIGSKLADKFMNMIFQDCLDHTIPNKPDALANYLNVIAEDVQQFQNKLIELGFLHQNDRTLLTYAQNMDVVFINKKSQEYLTGAIKIMKKDLHEYMEIGTPIDVNNPMKFVEIPQYTISKSANELWTLVKDMLETGLENSDKYLGKIVGTADEIFSSYITFVPEHHKKLLQTIPQQVALFYNNCLYLSYELQRHSQSHIELDQKFDDNIKDLKQVGVEMFKKCVEQHKDQNEKIIKDSGLTNVQTLENVPSQLEKSVRQCIRQQELLKTVWQKILTYKTYNETIGDMLNSLCTFLIQACLNFVDISSRAAEELEDVIKIIQTRGPKLFTEPKEISLYVASWYKFNELQFVLGANLAAINERWADGKGPLALQFTPFELRNLICALFQNTDVRSSVLAKLK